jgi:hypothetical protein
MHGAVAVHEIAKFHVIGPSEHSLAEGILVILRT